MVVNTEKKGGAGPLKTQHAQRILVTSALPYVNNVPHLGTMVCIISADVYTRFQRIMGTDVISVLGTDEHGTTTEAIALQMGLTPKQATDHFFSIHKQVYDWFNCGFDCFGRTSCEENVEITQDIFLRLNRNGFIIEKEEEQMFDENAGKFLSDRFIEGTCPFCGFKDARGDQCDDCGKLLNPTELKNPRSKLTGTAPVIKKTKHLYISLDKLQPKLEAFAKERGKAWSENALATTDAWFKEGLKERAITRDLQWGIPVPLKGYENKVFYVWFDAPIGYIAITKHNLPNEWREWWHEPDPKKVRLVQFMGKDNTPFHTVLFPASCIGADDNYTIVDTVSVNEYLNYEDLKFSKSRGIGVFGDNARDTGIPADVWRYYIVTNRPEKTDTTFTWKDLQDKLNNELAANFGNLVNRTLAFLARSFEGKVQSIVTPLDYKAEVKEILEAYEQIELKKALKLIMALSKKGNQYFQEQQPWAALKTDPAKANNAMAVLCNLIKDISILIQPVMPKTADAIHDQLGLKKEYSLHALETHILKDHKIGVPCVLFSKLEDKTVADLSQKFSGKQVKSDLASSSETIVPAAKKEDEAQEEGAQEQKDNFSLLDLRVAKIIEVRRHPGAEKLYIEKIDLGTEQREIVSGLVPYYKEEELLGKNIIVVTNLQPAKLRGVMSHGMLLAAQEGNVVGLALAPNALPGTRVHLEGSHGHHSAPAQITYDQFATVKLAAHDGVAFCEGRKLMAGDDIVRTEKAKIGPIR